MKMAEATEERWKAAIDNAIFFEKAYKETPMGHLALNIVIRPAIARYEAGERSEDLLEELESIE